MVNRAGNDVPIKLLALDSTTHDMILSCLDGHHLAKLSKLNREWQGIIQGFYRRAYNITNFLVPYFHDSQKPNLVDEFRFMQSQTGALISGSAALQFFARTEYPGSDLDLYVEHRYVEDVLAFLEYAGYAYEPRAQQHDSLARQIKARARILTEEEEYHQTGCRDIFDFKKGERKVQVVTTDNTPMDLILNFHSTVVMNVISHLNAFALYPKATFEYRFAVSTVRLSSEKQYEAALTKYRERGWDIRSVDTSPDIMGVQVGGRERAHHLQEFTTTIRCVGDTKTWTIPLPAPRVAREGYIPEELLHAHTWRPSTHVTQVSSYWEEDSSGEDYHYGSYGEWVRVYRKDLKMDFTLVGRYGFDWYIPSNEIPDDYFCICQALPHHPRSLLSSSLTMHEFQRRFKRYYTGSRESLLSELSKATVGFVSDPSSDPYSTGSEESLLSELSKALVGLVSDPSSDLYKPHTRRS